ncbi:endopeptidase La [Deferribacterales bacterium RsTz2092]|nr:Lon protease [Deferribacterales bacterium]
MAIIFEEHPIIPIRDNLILPRAMRTMTVGRPSSFLAMQMANQLDKRLFLTLQRDPKNDNPDVYDISKGDINKVGVVVEVRQVSRLPDNTLKVMVAGLYAATIERTENRSGCIVAVVRRREETPWTEDDRRVYMPALERALDDYAKIRNDLSPDLINTVLKSGEIDKLLYILADSTSARAEEKQLVLDEDSLRERIDTVVGLMLIDVEIMKLDENIRARVKEQMVKTNRDFHLSEQLKAIQQELGKNDDFKADIDGIEQKLSELNMPEEVKDKAERELRKMKVMAPMSAESSVVRNYLDWLVSIPWGEYTEDNLNLDNAEDVLNRDHYGLEKPKERILEYLAVRKLAQNMKGPIVCFVGPPGVGKTSLAKSIAQAMGRKFVRASLGGVHDEAEIRGHRRTYIGSMPGKIVQSIRKSGSMNPLFLLDEIDKIGTDSYRGDPASALLEALDPEQNKSFMDHYLDVEFDLSKTFFIATANTTDTIPSPLLDRMELIHISGYTEREKFHIAKKYLIPKQLLEHSLDKKRVKLADNVITELSRYYTKEAGVRNLEREVAALIRKAARKLTKDDCLEAVSINRKDVEGYLGKRKYHISKVYKESEVGVATGMAWTPYGGDILQIEVAMYEGSGKLMLTGQLGDVMQESAKTAFTVARSIAGRFDVPAYRFSEYDFHLHVPEGAVPKDGPSAGVTMATAILSAVADLPCNSKWAMTGEITLRGKALPVGGIKEKTLAAYRAGVTDIIMPIDNEKDLTDIPNDVKNEVHFHLVKDMDEILDLNILAKKRGDESWQSML